ncbi:GDSL esterase/lipase [Glycine soja]|nr:GDSL esterase/lipase [Glycine soja]
MSISTMRIMLVLATVVVAIIVVVPKRVKAVRAFFVFGDSPVDSGNNNYLPTISKRIGSEPTLPYMSPELNGQKLLVGANFASAGIGILNDTGIQFVGIIRMFQQFELFEQYQQRLSAVIGAKRTKKVVNEALVLMTLGGNTVFVSFYFYDGVFKSTVFDKLNQTYKAEVIFKRRRLRNVPFKNRI